MNKVFINDPQARENKKDNVGHGETQLPDNAAIRFEIDKISFIVQIDPSRQILVIEKFFDPGAPFEPVLIQPIHRQAIALT